MGGKEEVLPMVEHRGTGESLYSDGSQANLKVKLGACKAESVWL